MVKLKSAKQTGLREFNFLCAFILSEKFCGLFHKAFKPHYFENDAYRMLAVHARNYFEKYARPAKKLIISYIERHSQKFESTDIYEIIKKTLSAADGNIDALLEKYESQYIIDDAELFIKTAELKRNVAEIQSALEGEDEEAALKVYAGIIMPEVQKSGIISFEDDLDKQRAALSKKNNLVIHFKNEIGQLVGPLYKGDFFTWVAPTGTGKSWWLMWCAKQCREQGLNVLFLSLEMSEQSVLRRFQQLYYKRILYGEEFNEKVIISKFMPDDDKQKILRHEMQVEKLEAEDVDMLKEKYIGKTPHGRLKIVCRAGISMNDLKAVLSELKYQNNFIPDVILLDYADKMAVNKRVSNEREGLGIIWKDLRDLALDQNLLLFTASQTNRAAWDKHYTREAVAEDSRKLNEVTGAVGIMSDKRDRELGLIMLRLLKTRDGWFENRDVYCSCNFNIGQPVLQSVWADNLKLPDRNEQADYNKTNIIRKRKGSWND